MNALLVVKVMWSERQAAAVAAVFEALNCSGIRWLVLRNYEGLPYSNRSKDIDLALPKADLRRARLLVDQVMRSQGFNRIFNVSFQYADCNTYFFSSEDGVQSVKLDFLDGFVWRGARIANFDSMYARRVAYGDFFVPDRFDDGFMLWIKPLLTGGIVKDRYVQDIVQCVRDYPVAFRDMLKDKFGQKFADELWTLLECGDLQGTVAYQGRLRRAAWVKAVVINPAVTLGSLIGHSWYEVRRRLRRNPGAFLAVVGPDGVGKTTFITQARQELARVMAKDEDAIIVQHFRPHILPNIKQLLSGSQYDPSAEEFSSPHRAKPAGTVSSSLRIFYYWLDYVMGYWCGIRRRCAREYIYLFDRYFYDFVVDPRRSRLDLPRWMRMLFLRMTPQPDIVFFLDCDAETVYARKQELTLDEIARQLDVYRHLASSNPRRFVRLDASLPTEQLCRQAMLQLVERSFEVL